MKSRTVIIVGSATAVVVALLLYWHYHAPEEHIRPISGSKPIGQQSISNDAPSSPIKRIEDGTNNAAPKHPNAAPWQAFGQKYREGDYAWIVANAKSVPQAGSYSFAIKVLWECIALMSRGSLEDQLAKLNTSPLQKRELQANALKALFGVRASVA